MSTLSVPDERTWALWGRVLGGRRRPTAVAARAEALVLPARVPEPLHDALRALRGIAPARAEVVVLEAPLTGPPLADVFGAPEAEDHEHHDDHHGNGHDGHDHGDMMAVTGDPSSDGLVMEDVTVELGPVDPLLPTGLIARLTLDGDVVCGCELDAVLTAGPTHPDPAAADAWTAAVRLAASGEPPDAADRVRAVELARAVALAGAVVHLARVVGAAPLERQARAALHAAVDARAGRLVPAVAAGPADALLREVHDSRALRVLLRGLAVVTASAVVDGDLHGIAARAAGVARDVRQVDPAYEALAFQPVLADAGDAHGRLVCRCEEVVLSLRLADEAPRTRLPSTAPPGVESVFGPVRLLPGPLGAPPAVLAPGPDELRTAAAGLATGLEWSAAAAALASFDLTGWAP